MDTREANQKLQPVRDEFSVRFYRWAREFSHNEQCSDFTLISQIKNSNAARFLSFARSLNKSERSLFCSAILKRFHPRATELLKDPPSAKDRVILTRYSLARNEGISVPSKEGPFLPKAQFRKMLNNNLPPVLGDLVESPENGEVSEYRAVVGGWILSTTVDTGGRRTLGYEHTIRSHEQVFLQSQISALSWMGISSQTDWLPQSAAEPERIIECVKKLCSIFLAAAPTLLHGLTHSLPDLEVRTWNEIFTVQKQLKSGYTAVLVESLDLRRALGGNASWKIPTRIIPEGLRSVGSRLRIIQDPAYYREIGDASALQPAYRHLKIRSLD
jgi:hypothetical protein